MGSGALRCRFQHAAAELVFLDGDEQRPEIALAETLVALALDELEEDRPDRIRREYLQQHLGHAAFLGTERDCALAVDQDSIALKPGDVLAMTRDAMVDPLVVGVRRRRHEVQPIGRRLSIVV